jgi:phage terminase large subunit GpA-like protein
MNALSDVADLRAVSAAAFRPAPYVTALTYSETAYRLPDAGQAKGGKFIPQPWQRQVLAAWDEPDTRRVIVCASSQTGKTQLGLLLAGHAALYRPGPLLYVTATEETGTDFAKDRLRPDILANDGTRAALVDRRAEGGQTTVRLAFTTGSVLHVVGATSSNALASRPAKTVISTEARGFPPSTSGGQGDAFVQMNARTKSFRRAAREFHESSPATKGRCMISREAERGTQERYKLTCPHCQAAAPVRYFPTEGCHFVQAAGDPQDAGIACHVCGVCWTPQERLAAIRSGRFEPTNDNPTPGCRSFYYSELESESSTIASIVSRYNEAKSSPTTLAAWYNTCIGEPFDELARTVHFTPHELQKRAESYRSEVRLPDGVVALFAGVDTQLTRLEAQIIGVGANDEIWSLAYHVIPGEPGHDPTVWQRLTEILQRGYLHPSGKTLSVEIACIDSGGAATQTVYEYSHRSQARGLPFYAIKGRPGLLHPVIVKSQSLLQLGTTGSLRLQLVGVDAVKSTLFQRLDIQTPGPGFIHFRDDYEDFYFSGLTSERQVLGNVDKAGRQVVRFIHDKRIPNESLDTLVYAYAASKFHLVDVENRRAMLNDTPETTEPAAVSRFAGYAEKMKAINSGAQRR